MPTAALMTTDYGDLSAHMLRVTSLKLPGTIRDHARGVPLRLSLGRVPQQRQRDFNTEFFPRMGYRLGGSGVGGDSRRGQ